MWKFKLVIVGDTMIRKVIDGITIFEAIAHILAFKRKDYTNVIYSLTASKEDENED